jgi:hypothetical protein
VSCACSLSRSDLRSATSSCSRSMLSSCCKHLRTEWKGPTCSNSETRCT